MKLKWLGHASFLITAKDGTRIITDPYKTGGPLTYSRIAEAADIVTISHEHGDHNDTASVKGKPQVVRGPGSKTIKGIAINGVASYHDTVQGKERGANTVFCIEVDGIRIAHLGDLGHRLDAGQIKEVGPVDVLLTPVGGNYAIDGPTAAKIAANLKPKVVLPMHFKNSCCSYPITDAEPFLKGRANVRRVEGSEMEFVKELLTSKNKAVVLKPALA